mgnify:CR=1 FL=1
MNDLILSIDCCSLQWTTLGLLEGNSLKGELNLDIGRKQSALLPGLVQSFLCSFSLSAFDMDYFAVTNGPGSFTGIKVGVAFTQFTAWTAGKKIIPLSSLEIMAFSHIRQEGPYVLSMIQGGGGKAYAALFRGNSSSERPECLMEEKAYSPAELEQRLGEFTGLPDNLVWAVDDPGKISRPFHLSGILFSPQKTVPSGAAAVRLASLKKSEAIPAREIRGSYLKDPDLG